MSAAPAATEREPARRPWGIVGDDLTGVLAAAAELVDRGQRCHAALSVAGLQSQLGQVDSLASLAVTTESRHLVGSTARQLAFDAASALRSAGVERVLVKVDSMLRGPFLEQIDGVRAALDGVTVILCPAAPANQRFLVGGTPYDHGDLLRLPAGLQIPSGVPLHEALTERLREHIPLIGEASVCLGADEVVTELTSYLDSSTLILLDACTSEHLDVIASAGLRAGTRIFAGTAEMMGSLAEATAGRDETRHSPLPSPSLPILVSVGSASAEAQQQVMALSRHGARVIEVQPEEGRWQHAANEAIASARTGRSITVLTLPAPTVEARREPVRGLSRWLALATASALSSGPFSTLCAAGGETARAIIDQLGACTLDVVGTYEVGFVSSTIVGGSASGLHLLTKPGAHGDETALVRALLAMA